MSIRQMSMEIRHCTMHVSGAIKQSPRNWWTMVLSYRLQTKTATHRWTKRNHCWPSVCTIWPLKVARNWRKSVSKIKVGLDWKHAHATQPCHVTKGSTYVTWSCIQSWQSHRRAIHGADDGKRTTSLRKSYRFAIVMHEFHVISMKSFQNFGYSRIQIFCQWLERAIHHQI